MSNVHRIFVYGTLKEGFPNFAHNCGLRLAGEFVTCESYPLYLVGARRVPWLIRQPGEGGLVTGEVFEVDNDTLQAMDELERVEEPDGYRRDTIAVRGVNGSESQSVFVYVKSPQQFAAEAIREGPLNRYGPEHAARYVPRSQKR